MRTVNVFELLQRRALVTRESAKVIRDALASAIAEHGSEVAVDFAGVDAVTPSFVDEVLSVVDQAVTEARKSSFRVVFLHAPTRLSAKFAAVGRGRRLQISEAEPGAWVIAGEDVQPGVSD